MILITYTRQTLDNNQKKLDYTSVNSIEEFIEWFFKLGDRITYNLTSKNRILTNEGWVKLKVSSPEMMQAYDTTHKMLIKVQKVVSDEGILFEDIKHCSKRIVDQMALKCVKTN